MDEQSLEAFVDEGISKETESLVLKLQKTVDDVSDTVRISALAQLLALNILILRDKCVKHIQNNEVKKFRSYEEVETMLKNTSIDSASLEKYKSEPDFETIIMIIDSVIADMFERVNDELH